MSTPTEDDRTTPRTGGADLGPEVEAALAALVEAIDPADDVELITEILRTGARLGRDDVERLDLKITRAAIAEMRDAFAMFAAHRGIPKVTIFGSARTSAGDPLFDQARRVAAELAGQGWMVVTGAGPGIMLAGMQGAGRERSIGVNIRLPFEQSANEVITGDPKLVTMKYFFTRKLMLMKESAAFVALPGGFGTLDETLELLTLQQTGKAVPAPVVLLDEPGGRYWTRWMDFLRDAVEAGGYTSPGDIDLAEVTDDPTRAVARIGHFFRRYHSVRWVGDLLVIRMRRPVSDEQLDDLRVRFSTLATKGTIERSRPLPPEVADADGLDLERLVLRLDVHQTTGLHRLIWALNDLP